MKLSERSYPFPVVGNRDDVPGAAFQASIEMTADKEYIYIDVNVNCSSSTINEYVENGDVCYLLHVDCSNTFFRNSYKFSTSQFRQEISIEFLNDLIEINVFAVAVKKINDYRVEGAHEDYGDVAFDVNVADILAVGQTVAFHIDERFDSMKRVGSIMQIIENPKMDSDLPMEVDFYGQKITILMSKSDFREYRLLKSSETVIAPLTATIVFPVLLEALRILKSEFSGMEDGDAPKWVVVLRRKIMAMNIEAEEDFIKAQKILELPIKRSLSSAHQLAEMSDI
jgi:hypothetical protein